MDLKDFIVMKVDFKDIIVPSFIRETLEGFTGHFNRVSNFSLLKPPFGLPHLAREALTRDTEEGPYARMAMMLVLEWRSLLARCGRRRAPAAQRPMRGAA